MAVVGLGVGAAIALAAGRGPVPAAKPLARAVHDALGGPRVQGLTARISFTNHLIDASSLQGSDPILSGASGRLWVGANNRLRLELQSDAGDAQIVSDGTTVSVYDAANNTAYRAALPKDMRSARETGADAGPSLGQIQRFLTRLMRHAAVGGAEPTDVAGRPAYQVRIGPKHDGGLLGRAEIAFDAVRGVPLRIAVYARGSSSPVLELKATHISYGPVPSSTFDVKPPAGAKTVTLGDSGAISRVGSGSRDRAKAGVSGVAAVARSVPFSLAAPRRLVGLPRQEVRLLDWKGHPAALLTFGKGLGAIVVVEQAADPAASRPSADHGLSLPKVSIRGATGDELDTALGTLIRFTRHGVSYTVLGSVPPAAAEAAARGL